MSTAATVSQSVVPICLTTRRIENGKTMIATGWGSVDDSDTTSDVLKEVMNTSITLSMSMIIA